MRTINRINQDSRDSISESEHHHSSGQDEIMELREKLQQEKALRVKAEDELRVSRELFFRACNSNPCAITLTTLNEGKFIDVNECFYQLTGYQQHEVIGYTIFELPLCTDLTYREKLIDSIHRSGSAQNIEFRFINKSGQQRVGLLNSEILVFDGEPCLICTIFDNTEIQQIKEELSRLDNLYMMGELAAGIGHEIRNPLSTIQGFLDIFLDREEYLSARGDFQLLLDELSRVNTILDEFLSLAQPRKPDLQLNNLNLIINKLFPLIQASAMKAGQHIYFIPGNIPELLLDKGKMRQLILNLVLNGVEAMEPGGTLKISTCGSENEVVFSVADEGTGIPEEHIEKICLPFFTTKSEGTGLGMAVCYDIAREHNARIDIQTSPNGTTVSVIFPLNLQPV